jgi:putative phosphoesterase
LIEDPVLLGLIADTHMTGTGARTLPRACVERLAACDLIVHAGDVMNEAALVEIEAIGPPVAAVLGNVDAPELRRVLPVERVVEAGGARLGVIHDAGPRDGRLERMRLRFPDADAVVFGHSHLPLHERRGGFQIFNPGSPTERRRAPSHSMGLARVERGALVFELVTL